jgi:Flp pilus assembly protein TadD
MRPLRSPTWLAPLAVLLAACGGEAPGGTDRPGEPAGTLRARAVLLAADLQQDAARALLAPLAAGPDAEVEDLVRCGILELMLNDADGARAYAERAHARAPEDPSVCYLLGHLAVRDLEFERAAELYRKVLAHDPGDLPARMLLASALFDAGREDEAVPLWQEVQAQGVQRAGPLYIQATHRLGSWLIVQGRVDEGMALREENERLKAETGLKAPDFAEVEQMGYGLLALPRPGAPAVAAPPAADADVRFVPAARVEMAGAARLLAADLDRDGRCDLVGWGPQGLLVAMQDATGAFAVQRVHERPVLDVAAGDLDAGDRIEAVHQPGEREALRALTHAPLELVCVEGDAAHGGALLILSLDPDSGRWEALGPEGIQAGGFHAVALSDFDHDGWVDLVLPGTSGLRVMRNEGTARSATPRFPDASPEAGLALPACRAVVPEDVDADGDTDYLLATADGLALLSNLRGGRFEDVSADWNLPSAPLAGGVDPRDALAALDLDEDGRPDLALLTAQGLVWARHEGGRFAAPAVLDPAGRPGVFEDLDLDGHVDRVATGPDGLTWRRGPVVARGDAVALSSGPGPPGDGPGGPGGPGGTAGPPAAADLDGDGDLEFALLAPDGAYVVDRDGAPPGRALPLELLGTKDGAGGLGAVVELRTGPGPVYRRLYWTGGRRILGLGAQPDADVLLVVWPNGVVSGSHDAPAGQPLVLEQPKRLTGSCPFLYTWNGETFTFVTDVLGTTPLGLPMAPGVHVPFDHEEYVKVRGDQLVPKDGVLEIALTEELREVTYLDRLRLHAIDHPAGVEVQPDEGFVFPPFPPHHVHTFRTVRAPARVTDGEGRDWTERVAAVDGRHARAFHPLPFVFMGLAEPWSLEIELAGTDAGRAELAAAPRIRLALTGWMQWTDASVNVAAARHPDVAFEPPVLWVPDGDGWRQAGPPIGFPAGKTKTLVVDVTDVVDRADPRLRLTTTLQLSWDAMRVVLDDDDAPYVDTPLEPVSAELAFRGFSAYLPDPTGEQAERFDFDALQDARWNQHPGRYTRYGDVLPLLGAVDDMYVIFGAGDCLTARFDARGLPPLPAGWTRDWLVYLDGWAKDRDPNTTAAERVEPLPFHGMSAYPPPAGEGFPWDDARRAWDREWNTREGAVLIRRLAGAGVGASAGADPGADTGTGTDPGTR